MHFKKRLLAAYRAFGDPGLVVDPTQMKRLVDARVGLHLSKQKMHETLRGAVEEGNCGAIGALNSVHSLRTASKLQRSLRRDALLVTPPHTYTSPLSIAPHTARSFPSLRMTVGISANVFRLTP